MRLAVVFAELEQGFAAGFQSDDQSFTAELGEVHEISVLPDIDVYTGTYEITPQVNAQMMATRDKLMTDDVTVRAIPTYEVSNAAGGSTFYIASEV